MPDQKPTYGVDAPDVMRTFALIAFPSLLVSASTLFWPITGWFPVLIGVVLLLIGLITLFLYMVMYFYSIWGKFRQRDLMLTLIQWRGDEQVLDIGTGRGLLLIGAAKRLTTGKAVGIDIWNAEDLSGNEAENAHQNARLEGVTEKIEIRNEDARIMSFTDNSFDVILSLYCLHNIEEKSGQAFACQQIARVLKPGGTALIADYVPTHDYAKALAKAGLTIESSKPYISRVYSPMWMVIARKNIS